MGNRKSKLSAFLLVLMFTPAHAGLFDDLKDTLEKTRDVIKDTVEIKEKMEEIGGKEEEKARYDRVWVRELQRRLDRMGFEPGPADGIYGDKTAPAIRAFQASRGMAVSGEPTPAVSSDHQAVTNERARFLQARAVGFRNIAVHSYGTIDWTIVHGVAGIHPGDFSELAKAIGRYMGQDQIRE